MVFQLIDKSNSRRIHPSWCVCVCGVCAVVNFETRTFLSFNERNTALNSAINNYQTHLDTQMAKHMQIMREIKRFEDILILLVFLCIVASQQ